MSSYKNWSDYWENLCVKHKKVLHGGNSVDNKKFFQADMEELIFGTIKKLPGKEDGPFVIFSGFIDRIQFNDAEKTKREMMLFCLHSVGSDQFSLIPEAKSETHEVLIDFSSKLKKDANEGVNPVAWTFATGNNVSIIPASYKINNINYVGWQLVIELNLLEDFCFKPDNWNP